MNFLFDLSIGLFIFKSILRFYQKSFEKDDVIITHRILYILRELSRSLVIYMELHARDVNTLQLYMVTLLSTLEGS